MAVNNVDNILSKVKKGGVMTSLRNVWIGLSMMAFVVLFSGVSFANRGEIKLLRDSAALLEQSHPDLAKGLSKLAVEEEQEMKQHREALVKLSRDSASALQESRPELAEGLTKFADRKTSQMKGKKEQNEKQEEKEEKESVKLFKDSAAALQQSKPMLAEGLNKWANHEEKEIEEKQ